MKIASKPIILFLLLASLSGCRGNIPAWILQLPMASWFSGEKICPYGSPGACPPERVCAYVRPGRAECVKRYTGSTPFVRFPFAPDHAIRCIQGPETPGETLHDDHTFVDTLYALDLSSPSNMRVPGTVYAAMDGTALVHRGSDGFGNQVRILSPDGFVTFYAHLGNIWLEEGQTVRAGDPIGLEGKSGNATIRHLHFSVHYAPITSWLDTLAKYRNDPNLLPPSIPFEVQFCDPSMTPDCLRKRARMDKVPCGLEKKDLLRADWRP